MYKDKEKSKCKKNSNLNQAKRLSGKKSVNKRSGLTLKNKIYILQNKTKL